MPSHNKLLHGKVCLVTGATRGLGRATAIELARLGATVVIIGRNHTRIDQTVAEIRSVSGSAYVEGFLADLSSQHEVRQVAGEFLSRYPRLDVLVNNVGGTFLSYQPSPDGYEMSWALNYLNHFLLTRLLLKSLKETAKLSGEARVVEVVSSTYRLSAPHFDRLPQGGVVQGVLAYAKSKRALIVFACELARRLQGTGVTINAVSPGWVASDIAKDNGLGWSLLMRTMNLFAPSVDKGVQPIVHLASAPERRSVSGKFYMKYKEMPDDPGCVDCETSARLWQISEKMTCLEGVYEP